MKVDLENLRIGYHELYPNFGYYIDKLDSNTLKEVTWIANDIQKDFSQAHSHTDWLAGEIKHEYASAITPTIKTYMKGLAGKLERSSNYSKMYYDRRINKYGNESNWDMYHMWINYQQKYEYNPVHIHEGLYSWVIWYKLPYKIQEERKYSAKKQDPFGESDNHVLNGYFVFLYAQNELKMDLLPVDNNYEGYVAMFPSCLSHMVYPFYSSDDYRITLSGNVVNTQIIHDGLDINNLNEMYPIGEGPKNLTYVP